MQLILITIGKNQFTDSQIRSLEHIVQQHYRTHISNVSTRILWNQVPKGDSYKDYQQKQPSIISVGCEVGFDQEKRVRMFENCSEDWLAITGQDQEDLVIAILEQPIFEAFLKWNSQQLTGLGKLKFYIHILSSLVFNKTRKEYFAFDSSF
ncbi:hypothetical protein L0P88_19725 [Muricauda sp. SCSIO 64092]|uniref:hypothetical protein n=1 Tax=Allomuricauda sp. SCSIO 64092 TaxID=2908842 RepID=UPI001FF606BF|nr:hypothetical protein [Muricauda sp. SCSIO 64092]UOY06142.1 hypothetical protein L0P88_19725 [Muricauda sp. SCSIO 64092]